MENRKDNGAKNHRRYKIPFRREWVIALFAGLLATALPAAIALLFGLSPEGGEMTELSDASPVLLCRHGEGASTSAADGAEVTLAEAIALSLAATNASDTPDASLEAQAVVLRSRAVWWMGYCNGSGGDATSEESPAPAEAPPKNTLCNSPAHGLPFQSAGELAATLGSGEAAERIAAAERAVKATRGLVLCYGESVIPALLHTSAPGNTGEVESLPWLTSVQSPEEEALSTLTFAGEELRARLAAAFGILPEGEVNTWELTAVADSQGFTESVQIGAEGAGATLSGRAFARVLELPSPCYTLTAEGDVLTVRCRGVGSGCGLSREGAAIYADSGLAMAEILAHYYPECAVGVMGG